MSLNTLTFFQVLYHQLPCAIGQCGHVFHRLHFVADIHIWKLFLLTFMSLVRLNFWWTSTFLAPSLHTNTVCRYFCVTWHQFHLVCFLFILCFVRSSLFIIAGLLTPSPALLHKGWIILETGGCGLGKSNSSPGPLFFFPESYSTVSFQAHPEPVQSILLKAKVIILLLAWFPPFRILTSSASFAPSHHNPKWFFSCL